MTTGNAQTTSRGGFTLTELVFSMLLMGLLASVALPGLAVLLGNLEARSASRRFAMAHSLTRTTAIQHGGIAELRIDPASKEFWVQIDTNAAGPVADTVSFHGDFPTGLTLTSNRSRVCFDARGLTTTRTGCQPGDLDVNFTLGGMSEQIRTTVLGKLIR